MKENYEFCLAIILKEEGGNDDDPRDPGGRTSRGIIQREWNVFRQNHPNRPQDVWQASDEDIAAIYHDNYWAPYCDDMPSGIDLVFFNTSVNSGRTQAVRELQRALGIGVDGMMGMITVNALEAYHDYPGLIENLCDQRRNFYKALSTFNVFGKGWMARTARIEQAAISLAQKVPAKVVVSEHPEKTETGSPKASTSQARKPAIPPATSGSVTAGTGSLIAIINQIQQQLQQFAGTFHAIQYVLLALTIIGIIYTVYSAIKQNRVNEAIG